MGARDSVVGMGSGRFGARTTMAARNVLLYTTVYAGPGANPGS